VNPNDAQTAGQGFLAYLWAHPEVVAAFNLALALGLDWALGILSAIVRGKFDLGYLPAILSNQLATTEAKAIGTLLVSGAVLAMGRQEDAAYAAFIAFSGAASIYSVPTWRDVVDKLAHLFDRNYSTRGTHPAARRTAATMRL
jgi:hypothetical protein